MAGGCWRSITGERRIGVALSDELGILASPLCILKPRARDRVEAVAELAREHGVVEIVVGHPRTLRGEIGPQARRVERFVEELRGAVDVPVRLWDERYSTAGGDRPSGRDPQAVRWPPRPGGSLAAPHWTPWRRRDPSGLSGLATFVNRPRPSRPC